ncbi:MAG TPA: glycoside hydrolase family 31 protein [Armatimonadota bacterium]|jgi:alpha-D-xyloside xylohydrolase
MTAITIDNQLLVWHKEREIIQIEPWGADSLRVRITRAAQIVETPGALLPPTEGTDDLWIDESRASIRHGLLSAEIDKDGRIRFSNTATGAVLLEEKGHAFHSLNSDSYGAEVRFHAYADERLYGLGQHQHGFLDQKGCVIDLEQVHMEVAIPFLLSSRGYGLLWNNPAIGRVELGNNVTRWEAKATKQIDYWITAGEAPADILAHYADATGHAPKLPEWATGFWQSKLRYASQQELLEVAREHTRRGLPISVIVIDYFHWTCMGDWQFDPAYWPDPTAMVRELAEMGIKLMVSVWPTVNKQSENFEQLRERGLLVGTEHGFPATTRNADTGPEAFQYLHHYDATHPAAREFIWERVRENYRRHGITTWWLDACEPVYWPADHDNLRYYLGNGLEVGCIYPMMHQRAFYEGMRAEGEEEVLTLCRSAWAGSQRYAAVVWSGDVPSTFEALQNQLRAGLNIGLSGIPWWTTDIGGFVGGDVADPYFQELIVRWFQFGLFCPIFRLHGARNPTNMKLGGPNEVWTFGDTAYAIIRKLMFLRERLRPYIMAQMTLAHEKGMPVMRPLFVNFVDDPICPAIEDQYMFGPDILVAPMLEKGATDRHVYLPHGTTWIDAWTGEQFPGGQTIRVEAPLACIPVFLCGENGRKLSSLFRNIN